MSKKLEAARTVAAQLYVAEDAIDSAIREAARLTLAVTDARADLHLASVVGGEVFDRAAALQGALAAARAQAAALHEALAGVRDQLRIRMDFPDFGTPNKPPKTFALSDASPAVETRRLRTA